MKIIGIDPGFTTGIVIAELQKDVVKVIHSEEVALDDNRSFHTFIRLVTMHSPDIAVIEKVVLHGPFNRDKFHQCLAYRDAVLAVRNSLPSEKVSFFTPEQRKRMGASPIARTVVKGNHAKDAFSLIVAYLSQHHKELWVKLNGNATSSAKSGGTAG